MSVEDNKAIARRFIQVWSDENLDTVEELAAPSLVVRYPTIPEVIRGSREFRHVLAGFRSAFPDSSLRVEEEIAEGEKVVIRWNFSGTHKGESPGRSRDGQEGIVDRHDYLSDRRRQGGGGTGRRGLPRLLPSGRPRPRAGLRLDPPRLSPSA